MSTADTAAKKPQKKPAARRSRWRRVLRWGVVLVVLLLALRVGGQLAAPWVLDRVAARYGLSLTWKSLSLTLLRGEVELEGVVLAHRADAESTPYLELDQVRADLRVRDLLAGRIVVQRVEADSVRVFVERRADGRYALEEHLPKRLDGAAAEPAPVDLDAPIELGIPLEITALRLHDVQLRFRDASVTPAVDVTVRGGVRASHVGSKRRDATFEVMAVSPELVDRLHVLGTVSSGGQELEARFDVDMVGLHLASLASLLRPDPGAISCEYIDRTDSSRAVVGLIAVDAGRAAGLAISGDRERVAGERD